MYILDLILKLTQREELVDQCHAYLRQVTEDVKGKVVPLEKYVINKGLTKNPEVCPSLRLLTFPPCPTPVVACSCTFLIWWQDYPDKNVQPHVQVCQLSKTIRVFDGLLRSYFLFYGEHVFVVFTRRLRCGSNPPASLCTHKTPFPI
jgi:hypothetical protein